MEIEIAKMSRMAERGSSLLRLIQNTDTPVLDLLVRESVQNSLDATNNEKSPVKYDISIKQFKKKELTKHFEGISDSLERTQKGDKHESIVIRDCNTTGLTGPIHHEYIENGNYGNLLKLIYEISMPQSKQGAGGSWGLGKTVYFRLGIGLVIYYSRIKKENGLFEQRLAACLVEDETKQETVLPQNEHGLQRGIAWWGEKHTEESTKPLTDDYKIKEILKDLNVKAYDNEETGTTVIIPFVNTEKLIPKSETNQKELWWHTDIEYYLRVAIQRWYAPRIDNNSFPFGFPLSPSVNEEEISADVMVPFFSIIRSLYISASTNQTLKNDNNLKESNIKIKEIKLNKDLANNVAGRVAFAKVTKDDLKMTIPDNNKSPFQFLELLEEDPEQNSPILTFTRKPGLLINYETVGKWVRGIQRTERNEYLIGVFVPDSNNSMTNVPGYTLEDYLRKSEKADHTSWSDLTIDDKKYTITDRIQKKVSSLISTQYQDNTDLIEKRKSGALGKALATELLPPIGFGKKPNVPSKPKGGEGAGKKKLNYDQFIIQNIELNKDGDMLIHFVLSVRTDSTLQKLEIEIETEGNSKINGDDWEEEIGTSFPLEIKHFTLEESNTPYQTSYDFTRNYRINNIISIYLEKAMDAELKGNMTLVRKDLSVQASIHHTSEKKLYEEHVQ
ncbi:hypothetical protein [Guptibacillus sedimenti]|uniref:hypothetical protein n=1 Tax=Guptibacillus sedimenti TaxID=3025680 RepID=UPI0023604DED|nr:hypothetical protein [Pseudalkalibacillus sedimenti]